jgi:hypothetical protein
VHIQFAVVWCTIYELGDTSVEYELIEKGCVQVEMRGIDGDEVLQESAHPK